MCSLLFLDPVLIAAGGSSAFRVAPTYDLEEEPVVVLASSFLAPCLVGFFFYCRRGHVLRGFLSALFPVLLYLPSPRRSADTFVSIALLFLYIFYVALICRGNSLLLWRSFRL